MLSCLFTYKVNGGLKIIGSLKCNDKGDDDETIWDFHTAAAAALLCIFSDASASARMVIIQWNIERKEPSSEAILLYMLCYTIRLFVILFEISACVCLYTA